MKNIMNKNKKIKNDSGYTLIEMVVYVALIGIIVLFIYGVISFIYFENKKIVNLTRINSSAYGSIERIRYEVENSNYIYLPTSNMANYNYDAGKADQLSLATEIGVSSPEDITFVDFYLENETIFLKKEGLDPIALTSSDVLVSDLSFSYYKNDWRESVTIGITIESKDSSISSVNLISTIALRSS